MEKIRVVQISESDFSVQGHGVHTAFVETLNGLSKRADVVVSKNNFQAADIRHIHTVGPYSLAQILFASGKKVVSAHVIPESFVGSLRGAKYWFWLAKIYLRFFYNRAALVIAVSDNTKDDLVKLGVKKPIEVIYNMIDTSKYRVSVDQRETWREELGFGDSFVVVGNGQVQPRKRVDTFMRVARELPDMKFIWVGGMPFGHAGDDYRQMHKLMTDTPSNVTVTGVVPLDEVRKYFAAADAFMMPSVQETFGLAIVEAAASGLPVILRDIHDYDRTFRADAAICREEDFVATLKRLSGDNEYYATMKKHALILAAHYDSEQITARLVAAYHSLVAEK